jgi:hypothetical protein
LADTDPPQSDEQESDAIFACHVCGDSFSADGVYEHEGRIICVQCYEKSLATPPKPAQVAPDHAASAPGGDVPAAPQAVAPAPPPRLPSRQARPLVVRVTCPHCWNRCAPEDLLWVSKHADLLGDAVMGAEAQARFLPSRFTAEGRALDARGMACDVLACPQCHLSIPRPLVEEEPLFVSVIGGPSSGKSYLLTAMTWQLRRLLPGGFAVAFNDADTTTNRALNEYEETLFLHGDGQSLVAIRKTELQGELYDQVRWGTQIVTLPRPFIFTLRPTERHPNAAAAERVSRVVCLYDNAGEHFQPGMDLPNAPVTQHLGRSRALMFLYDPTQDPRLREVCRKFSNDPQLSGTMRTHRQEILLTEAALRIRRYAGLSANQKYERPLVVIVPKSDVWSPLLDLDVASEPVVDNYLAGGTLAAVDLPRVDAVSAKVRAMLLTHAPEVVGAAEDFSQRVVYVPVSALGRAPEVQPGTNLLGVRPRDIRPHWVTVPLLYMLARWSTGLIGGVPRDKSARAGEGGRP